MPLCVPNSYENSVVCSRVMTLGWEGFLNGADVVHKKNSKKNGAVADGILLHHVIDYIQ